MHFTASQLLLALLRHGSHPDECVAMQRGWQIKDKVVYFDQRAQDDLQDLPAVELMNHTLTYARELERIV